MRIAQVAPLYENVPPTGYGGTERVIAGLCDGLVEAGHDVTLFATGRSHTSARLESFIEAPLRERMDAEEMAEVSPHLHLRMLTDIYSRSDEFDVIHAHTDVWTLPFAELSATPTVITMHGRLDIPVVQRPLSLYPGAALVSISDHQRLALEGCPVDWLATIPNGLDLARLPPPGAGRRELPRLRRSPLPGEASGHRRRDRRQDRLAVAGRRQGRPLR